MATVIETTNAGMYSKAQVALEVDHEGRVTGRTVPHSQEQGHETTLAMLVARALEIPAERVTVRQGLEEPPLTGNHTGGSRNTVGCGTICHLTALKLIEQGKARVAEQLAVEPSQIHYAAEAFHCSEPEKTIALHELASDEKFSLIGEGSFGATFPNDCHIAEVEIDPDTGQLLTGSFFDYYLPRAGLIKHINMNHHPTPSRVSPLGVKGMGEAGCTGALPALTNAVMDALQPLGVAPLNMPLTPAKIWAAIAKAKRRGLPLR